VNTQVAAPDVVDSGGMNYLVSLPRRVVTVYVPVTAFLIVLLFPFYWMAITAFKPDEELLSREGNPFWVKSPTLAHVKKLLFDTAYPDWLWNTILVTVVSTFISIFASVLAAYAIERLRFRGARYVGMSIFLAYLVPPSILFIPLAVPGLISAGIFAFTLSWNEFIYALTFVSSSEVKTVPVGVVTELVEGDVYHWGSLMAGALFGSLPVAILYSFFVEYYVSGLTGAVKE
jgi:ABC-type glycerol-3-phosphate transport system permease component